MKHRMAALTAASILLISGSLLAGCGGGSSEKAASDTQTQSGESAEHQHAQEGHPAMDSPADAGQATNATPPAPVIPAGTEVTLTGTVGCGHCTHQIGNSCSTALQTADGGVWILDGIGAGNELFENRFDAAEITMAGVVHYVDGVAHLTPKEGQESDSEM